MRLKKDNGKDIIILTDDEIIIKGIFKDKVLKRDNILSAWLLDDTMGNKGIIILTKDYKIVERRSVNMKWSDREKLKLIVDEINTNDILFNYNYDKYQYWFIGYYPYLFWFIINDSIINEESNLKLVGGFFCLLLIIIMIIVIYNINKFRGVIYNAKMEEFQVVGKKAEIVNKFTINDIELDKKFKDDGFRFRVKESGYKFYIKKNTISYPTEYERLKDQVKSIALKSQLKNSH